MVVRRQRVKLIFQRISLITKCDVRKLSSGAGYVWDVEKGKILIADVNTNQIVKKTRLSLCLLQALRPTLNLFLASTNP